MADTKADVDAAQNAVDTAQKIVDGEQSDADAQKALDIDLEHSLMIGDHASDLIAASNAGIKECYLVGDHLESEKAKFSPLKLAKNLVQVVENLKNEKK